MAKWSEPRNAMSVRAAAWERVTLTDEAEEYIRNLAYEAGYHD